MFGSGPLYFNAMIFIFFLVAKLCESHFRNQSPQLNFQVSSNVIEHACMKIGFELKFDLDTVLAAQQFLTSSAMSYSVLSTKVVRSQQSELRAIDRICSILDCAYLSPQV